MLRRSRGLVVDGDNDVDDRLADREAFTDLVDDEGSFMGTTVDVQP